MCTTSCWVLGHFVTTIVVSMAFAEPVVYARHQFYEACTLFSHFSDEEIEAQRVEVARSW